MGRTGEILALLHEPGHDLLEELRIPPYVGDFLEGDACGEGRSVP